MLRAGEILRERRLDKKLTLDDVSKATKIKVRFLEAIEKGRYSDLPSSSYAQGFVRNYAEYLGFSARQILPLFKREFDDEKEFRIVPKGFEREEDFPIRKFRFSRGVLFVLGIFLIVFLYILFQYRYAFINPPLTVNSPKENATVIAQEIDVAGQSDPNSTVSINGNAVVVDQNGNFKKSVEVFLGANTIKIRVVNRFGRETDLDRHINVQTQ